MKLAILISLLLAATPGICQDSVLYKNSIDSIIVNNSKKDKRKIIRKDDFEISYFYNSNTKELVSILLVTKEKIEGGIAWSYFYNFDNGELIRFGKWNGRPLKDKSRKIASCYLKDGAIVYREEYHLTIEDIEAIKTRGQQLKNSAPSL